MGAESTTRAAATAVICFLGTFCAVTFTGAADTFERPEFAVLSGLAASLLGGRRDVWLAIIPASMVGAAIAVLAGAADVGQAIPRGLVGAIILGVFFGLIALGAFAIARAAVALIQDRGVAG